jgi:septal ring-binding cell division protein DamX
MAQNLFHGKIPAVDLPVKSPTKIESMPPDGKKAVPSQPTEAPSEISEPQQKTDLVQPLETQTKIETTPPMAKAVPSQPTEAPSEKSELRQEAEPHPSAEPQTKIETIRPAEEQPVSSQPTVAPSEQRELPEKADLRQAEVRPQPVKEDVIEKTEERIIHREKWLLSQESPFYTIQLMGARKEALLFNFVEKNQLLEQNEIAFYQTTFKDKPWFQLLYGVYATKKDAQSAADNLPPKIRKSSPWIRRLSAVQKAIRRKAAQSSPGGTKKEHRTSNVQHRMLNGKR